MSTLPALRPICRPMTRSIFDAGKKSAERIISDLFAQGQQGFWLPFTDFASLSQDSAGTLPYTALEQPVGRVLDRSGRGNHASQVTSTARGVVSARVNLLASTQSFGGGSGWAGGTGIVITPADTPSPFGGMADKIEMTAVGSEWRQLLQIANTVLGTSYSGKLLVKAAAPEDIGKVIAFRHAGASAYLFITLTADWAWVGRDEVCGNSSTQFTITHRPSVGTTSGVISFHLAAAELKLSNQASLPYQRVNTATDYDAVGFPKYLRLDGTDDLYTCGGGGSTTGFFFSDVVRPMGGAGTRRVIWSDRSGNNGYELAINTANKLEFSAGTGTAITAVASTVSADVADGKRYEVMDDGTNLSVQIDGSAAVTVARPVVTAGSSTITLYRGAPTGYFNGQATEPIYRAGPPPSAYEREVIRNYQMQKAGML